MGDHHAVIHSCTCPDSAPLPGLRCDPGRATIGCVDTVRDTGRTATRPEVSATAYQRLRDLVAEGRLAAGAPLIEADLSKWLGVSRTPIRAALQRLQQEGFVTPSPVGQILRPIVSPLTASDLREVFLMVGALEAAAARIAAGLDACARDTLVGSLERITGDLRAAGAARPPDLAQALDLCRRFHRMVVEAGAGPRLQAEFDVLQPQAERYGRVYAAAVLLAIDQTVAEYEAISAAIGAGDPDGAERGVAVSWRRSADRFRHVVATLGELGTW
jgi:DNA-binding GntR family transcriptional regulator